MLIVSAEYRAKPGTADRIAETLSRHVAATRQEPGCVEFTAFRDAHDPHHFVLHERYVDEDSFQAHRRTEHFKSNIEETIAPLLLERRWARLSEIPATPEAQ